MEHVERWLAQSESQQASAGVVAVSALAVIRAQSPRKTNGRRQQDWLDRTRLEIGIVLQLLPLGVALGGGGGEGGLQRGGHTLPAALSRFCKIMSRGCLLTF